ncbi:MULTISPECIES: fibrobacter succinogenes major paralogous domain-containing protein [unclassified Fibrobacter]|uniref:fibrobacter succinogenes major paralogous domain-containing protein n=1 Tax=unclassified Fibrobacter TaxID=2634177 RepID=UPI0025BB1C2A|nr:MULTISPECIES: fibrobacter succinogenes major paralogous domain-containing protein [unclassified Fibrobacter]
MKIVMIKEKQSKYFSKVLLVMFVSLLAEISFAATHVAVLETVSEKDVIGRSEKVFLTDKLRDRAKVVLPAYMGYIIMTRENINAMLPPGKVLEECEGSCLVETGKNIAADYVAQARVGKFGKQLTLTVELYETSMNNLVASFTTRKDDAVGLLEDVEHEADDFFGKILPTSSTKNGGVGMAENKSSPDNIMKNTLTDPRDGKKYRTVTIGSQVWMAENINYKPKDGWVLRKSFCYDGNEDNCEKYGRYYVWDVLGKVCPTGWRLPSKNDFETLLSEVGEITLIGKKLKSAEGWNNGKNGDDSVGFSLFPTGARDYVLLEGERFLNFGSAAFIWSSSENKNSIWDNNPTKVFAFAIRSNDKVSLELLEKRWAFPVRCVKD